MLIPTINHENEDDVPPQPDLSRVSWQEPGSADAVRARLVDRIEAVGGRVETDGSHDVKARFGSRTRYRLWGLFFANGRAALPVAMTATCEGEEGSVTVDMTLQSDQGFHVIRLPQVGRAYEARFTELADRLQP